MMPSELKNKILNLQQRLRLENESIDTDRQNTNVGVPGNGLPPSSSGPGTSPAPRRPRQLMDSGTPTRPRRHLDLPIQQMLPQRTQDSEFDSKLLEIMKMNGILSINGQKYQTDMKDLEHLGELGNGTCGHVVKMRHRPSGVVIAVKQMRRSGNAEENKRIIMDLDVVLKSHDCPYIVQCLGCFITESDVWICMELMATCLDKLLKRCRQAIPEEFLGKVTVATVKALSYLKESHGVIHRDVKPSNILLDETGGVKLCDFGISGRLVDSKAKTRSAGCAAYMAPERIDPPDPTKPDYDIRADVWSLGITLVELATGVFPYRDCKNDFEVLSRVVQDEPPTLPSDTTFSKEFRSFVNCCLTKNYKHRPKYHKLLEHPFLKKHDWHQGEREDSSSPSSDSQWFITIMRQLEPSCRPAGGEPLRISGHVSLKQTAHLRSHSEVPAFLRSGVTKELQNSNFLPFHQRTSSENGSNYLPYSPYVPRRKDTPGTNFSPQQTNATTATKESGDRLEPSVINNRTFSPFRQESKDTLNKLVPDVVNPINGQGRPFSPFRQQQDHQGGNFTETRNRPYSPFSQRLEDRDGSRDRWQGVSRSLSPFARDYSPWRRENVDPPGVVVVQPADDGGKYSPFMQQRVRHPLPQTHPPVQDIYGSPLVNRKRFPSEPPAQGSTSPQLLISRYAHQHHQRKQEISPPLTQVQGVCKESAKKRFASYVRLRLGSDRAPSPEPPPRLNRGESPLALRRNIGDQSSPSFSRRYVSPSPPQPPPRRLSESSSVPGSPQHVRTRLRYTPEPQRRPPPT